MKQPTKRQKSPAELKNLARMGKKVDLHARVDRETQDKIRKLAKLTDFTASYIVSELLKMSFKTALAKDLFWLYLKDHSDPFLQREITEGNKAIQLLKDSFSVIESVFCEQEERLRVLENSQTHIVNGLKQVRQFPLTKYLKDVKKE